MTRQLLHWWLFCLLLFVLARKDIDVIVCGTPDHWHAQITIDAVKSGKDVYCEKPLTLTIAEGRKMVEAARKHCRIVSGGSQRVLQDYGRMACSARSGKYGKIIAKHVTTGGPSRHCNLPAELVPDWIDWNMWLGPVMTTEEGNGTASGFGISMCLRCDETACGSTQTMSILPKTW